MSSDRIRQQVEAWRKELVSLDKRNRLLYFKHTKTSSLELLERTPATIWGTLGTSGSSGWSFAKPAAEGEGAVPLAGSQLRTDKADESAQSAALKNLERRTTQEYLDKGLWILYVGLGMLRWRDPDEGSEVSSPLLLVPADIRRSSPREPHRLRRAEEDVVVNPALSIKLDSDFGITLPEFDPDVELEAFFGEVGKAVRKLNASVEQRAVLATFSFHKEVMFRDLLEHADEIADHPLIAALADPGSNAARDLDFSPIPFELLDTQAPPEDMVSVLPADSSQRRCIVAAAQGQSFVMDGPPGTGKSQTIANLIAELLHAGRTVLFVSEKAAALEVVRSRLDDAGLGEFLLELHSHKATRKEVAAELGRALSKRVVPGWQMPSGDVKRAKKARLALSRHAAAVNEVRTPLGMSLHSIFGRVASLSQVPRVSHPEGFAGGASADALNDVTTRAGELGRAWGPVTRGDGFLWRNATGTHPRPRLFDELHESIEAVRRAGRLFSTETQLPEADGPASMHERLPLVRHLARRPDIPSAWLSDASLEPINEAVAKLAADQSWHGAAVTELNDLVGQAWRALPVDAAPSLLAATEALSSHGWTDWTGLEAAQAQELLAFLRHSVADLADLSSRCQKLAATLRLGSGDVPFERGLQLAELGALAGSPHRPDPRWLNPLVQEALDRAARVLEALVNEYRAREQALSDSFAASVLELDLVGLEVRFRDVHRGLRKLSGGYRADKRALATAARSGKASKDIRARVGEAREWQDLSRRLIEAEQQHAPVIGDAYYRHTATDFGAVVSAVEVARRAIELVGRDATSEGVLDQLAATGHPDAFMPQEARAVLSALERWAREAERVGLPWPRAACLGDLASWCSAVADHLELVTSVAGETSALTSATLRLGDASRAVRSAREVLALEESYLPERYEGLALGPRFVGLHSDVSSIAEDLGWAVSLRELLTQTPTPRVAVALAASRVDDVAIEGALGRWEMLRNELIELFRKRGRQGVLDELHGAFADVTDYLDALRQSVPDIDEWVRHTNLIKALLSMGFDQALADLQALRVEADVVAPSIERSALEALADYYLATDDRLDALRSFERDQLVTEFQELDRDLLRAASGRVVESVNSRRPTSRTGVAGTIEREAQKQRRHMPVRKLLADTAPVTQRLKPCFMMSPLTVSQFLGPGISFDVVIFDEASQVVPADAINCIYRASQLVVAGDQKQLPPTSFFRAMGEVDDSDDYDEEQLDEFESLLDLCKGSGGFPSLPLQWHYRSQHEALITFSNYRFYEGNLVTFPGSAAEGSDVGVELIDVPSGVYRRGGPRDNPVEAAAVVDRIIHHARLHPNLTCGVVAFSEAQAAAIEVELERRRHSLPELDAYFQEDRLGGFFVKNLENVQGDERDVILFSIGYGRDEAGKLTNNFGPINGRGGWRRLNVAVTRARRRVEVVASIGAGDITGTTNPSVLHLKNYLDYASRGVAALALDLIESEGDAESVFEEEVAQTIRGWGYEVVPQVGTAGYRIDMAVRHPARPGVFALGIECDGVMYHSSKVARDRDRLREEVLRGLGWELHRIWGTAWYRDRAGEEARLKRAIQQAIDGVRASVPTAGVAERVEVEYEEEVLDETPPWTENYTVCDVRPGHLYGEFHDPYNRDVIADAIRQVVDVEGPIHQDRALRRVREAFGIGRAGNRVRSAFELALDFAVRQRLADVDGDFLVAAGGSTYGVRVPDPDYEDTKRKVEEVYPGEMSAALLWLVTDAQGIPAEELLVAVARLFGWGRVGSDIRSALEEALDLALDDGGLVVRNGLVQLESAD